MTFALLRRTSRLALAGGLMAVLAVGWAGCATEKDNLQRSDVEQWYKDGTINRVTYLDMMQKIDAKEAAQKAGQTPAQQPPAVAPPSTGQPAAPPPGQAPY